MSLSGQTSTESQLSGWDSVCSFHGTLPRKRRSVVPVAMQAEKWGGCGAGVRVMNFVSRTPCKDRGSTPAKTNIEHEKHWLVE